MKNYHGSRGPKINSTRLAKNALTRWPKLHDPRPQSMKAAQDTNINKEDKQK